MSEYPYGSGDLLENRNTYFYSAYVGLALFPAWSAQRTASLQTSGVQASHAEEPEPTDSLIASLIESLTDSNMTENDWLHTDRLVQRFEVSKRLHAEYKPNWRPVRGADYTRLDRYLGFAELMQRAYRRTGRLQYVNALLKCMDTLSSATAKLDPDQLARMGSLVQQERSLVQELADRLGVPVPPPDGSVSDGA